MRTPSLLLLLLVAGCSTSPDGNVTGSPSRTTTPVASPDQTTAVPAPTQTTPPQSSTNFSVVRLPAGDAAQRAGLESEGALEGLQFTDGAGTNVLLLRRRPNTQGGAELLADHIVYPNSQERQVLREVRDGVPDCSVDMIAEFVPESLTVTDYDEDGYGEASFAYRLNCSGDPSPDEQKLLVLEQGEKYILRGFALSPLEPFVDPRPEPAPSAWPPGTYDDSLLRFRDYARK